jgi:hypothetical protein
VKEVAKRDMQWRVSTNENLQSDWDIYFAELGVDSELLSSLKPYQKINHFPATYHIARKTLLAKNLKRF